MVSEKIDLAHEADFALGRLTVRPSRRELVRDDGASEVLEHRVMQVLIALAKARGGIVTRDELTASCWDGRVVGEDAINRVMSRLRKAAGSIGAGSFGIETVTRIGYRLTHGATTESGLASRSRQQAALAGGDGFRPSRRAVLTGAVAAGVLSAAGGGALLYRQIGQPAVSPEIEMLMAQAWQAWTQGSREGMSQATGLYRHVTQIAPDFADGWGLLGCCYADDAHFSPAARREALRVRALAAARRALELDPRNAYGEAAIAYAQPFMGGWLVMERAFRRALERQPEKQLLRHGLGLVLLRVGRASESARNFAQLGDFRRSPRHYQWLSQALWSAGRPDDVERILAEAAEIFPTHPIVWFQRFNIAMYSDNPGAAIAQAQDVQRRPSGIEDTIEHNVAAAHALESRDPAQIDAVMATQMQLARQTAGLAARAMTFASAIGRLDQAFALADAYYFSRGFTVPESSDPVPGAREPNLESRDTSVLFLPPTRPMREDPRFARLVEEIGLERYWREVGVQPDYRRA
jgi:DNA-binding winged helix-turn-helix (wHTH) protein/tetratricopeptide (TPR) repeat protein